MLNAQICTLRAPPTVTDGGKAGRRSRGTLVIAACLGSTQTPDTGSTA